MYIPSRIRPRHEGSTRATRGRGDASRDWRRWCERRAHATRWSDEEHRGAISGSGMAGVRDVVGARPSRQEERGVTWRGEWSTRRSACAIDARGKPVGWGVSLACKHHVSGAATAHSAAPGGSPRGERFACRGVAALAHLSQPVIELVSECAKPECSKHTAPAAGCAGWLAGGRGEQPGVTRGSLGFAPLIMRGLGSLRARASAARALRRHAVDVSHAQIVGACRRE